MLFYPCKPVLAVSPLFQCRTAMYSTSSWIGLEYELLKFWVDKSLTALKLTCVLNLQKICSCQEIFAYCAFNVFDYEQAMYEQNDPVWSYNWWSQVWISYFCWCYHVKCGNCLAESQLMLLHFCVINMITACYTVMPNSAPHHANVQESKWTTGLHLDHSS